MNSLYRGSLSGGERRDSKFGLVFVYRALAETRAMGGMVDEDPARWNTVRGGSEADLGSERQASCLDRFILDGKKRQNFLGRVTRSVVVGLAARNRERFGDESEAREGRAGLANTAVFIVETRPTAAFSNPNARCYQLGGT